MSDPEATHSLSDGCPGFAFELFTEALLLEPDYVSEKLRERINALESRFSDNSHQ